MAPLSNKYKAYSAATRTVAKTRQVVMLYDGAIRFLKQAMVSIEENRIEERFKLLTKASEIMVGLQSSIDFDNGGDIANVLHSFYTNVSRRIVLINFTKEQTVAKKQCEEVIAELKQMRDTWDGIDHTLGNTSESAPRDTSSSDGASGSSSLSA